MAIMSNPTEEPAVPASAASPSPAPSEPTAGAPSPSAAAQPSAASTKIAKPPKIKPLKVGYLSIKEGNVLKKAFKPRFCILNKNNELEYYRDPNVRRSRVLANR